MEIYINNKEHRGSPIKVDKMLTVSEYITDNQIKHIVSLRLQSPVRYLENLLKQSKLEKINLRQNGVMFELCQ